MTPFTYPASLPCFRWEPYGVAPRPGSLEMTLGMQTHRAMVYTQNNEMIQCETILSSVQEQAFRTFFKTTLSMGTQWFTAPILRNGGIDDYEVMFLGTPPAYVPANKAGYVRARFTLLTRGDALPEPVYELTSTHVVNIEAEEFAHAASQPAAPGGTIVTIATNASDYILITKPPSSLTDLDNDAWSPYSSNVFNGGLTWANSFLVSNQDDDVVGSYNGALQANATLAYNLVQLSLPIQIIGHTQYKFWFWDTPIDDNRGGLSLRVEVYSVVP